MLKKHSEMHAGIRNFAHKNAAYDLPTAVFGVQAGKHGNAAHAVVQHAEAIKYVRQIESSEIIQEIGSSIDESKRFKNIALLAIPDTFKSIHIDIVRRERKWDEAVVNRHDSILGVYFLAFIHAQLFERNESMDVAYCAPDYVARDEG